MQEPKFKRGQLIKYTVGEEVRYNHILEPVWNSAAGQYLYRLDEPMAMPVYREDWLEAVQLEELEKLVKANEEHRVRLNRHGYMTVEGGLQ